MSWNPYLECSFLIPIYRDADLSDGQLHSPFVTEWLKDQLYILFGGVTVAPGEYKGFYKDPDTGQRISDKSHKYEVAVPKPKLDELRELLSEACVVFQQKIIYLSVAGEVEFIKPPET